MAEDIFSLQTMLTKIRREGNDGYILKIKTTPLQNAIIIASIMGSILSMYNYKVAKERTAAINTLRQRIKKFMYIRSRSNKNEFLRAVSYADMAWQTSIAHFVKHKFAIEAVATTLSIYSLYAEVIAKYANVREKQITAFARGMEEDIPLEIEQNSYLVTDFLLDEIAKFTGVQRRKLNFIKKESAIDATTSA
ncbi:MAG: hypothetical protein QG567_1765 [Campylobacterota bacterium]|nr:hypothetical protein [Campylobacterota bacterium]MDQ1340607.1 hypothetical protein [Campylobacterota bacterium]